MVKLVRLVTLFLEGVLLQFVQGVGFVALFVSAVAGFVRGPSWIVPVFALVFGLGVEELGFGARLMDKAASASERWAFMVLIYFVIALVGYLLGIYGRHYWERRRKQPVPGK